MKFNDNYKTTLEGIMEIEADFNLNLLFLDNYVLTYKDRTTLLKDYSSAIRNFPEAVVIINSTKEKIKGLWR